jgi:hypothetical protein
VANENLQSGEQIMSNIEQRLAKLESQVRRWKLATLVLVVMTGGFAFMGAGADEPKSIKVDSVTAKKFLLVDPEGRQRGEWYVDEDGWPEFVMHGAGANSKERLQRSIGLTCNDKNCMLNLEYNGRSITAIAGKRGVAIFTELDGKKTVVALDPK